MTGLVTGSFNWLYPIPVVAAIAGLLLIREQIVREITEVSLTALLAGVVACLIWISLIPEDIARSTALQEEFLSAPFWIASLWLIFRIIGSAVVVPVAEELAFRGFAMQAAILRLSELLPGKWPGITALIATSVAYGAVHDHVITASSVGLIYGGVRLWTGRVWDAIIAHAVSNVLLALYVLLFSAWAHW